MLAKTSKMLLNCSHGLCSARGSCIECKAMNPASEQAACKRNGMQSMYGYHARTAGTGGAKVHKQRYMLLISCTHVPGGPRGQEGGSSHAVQVLQKSGQALLLH